MSNQNNHRLILKVYFIVVGGSLQESAQGGRDFLKKLVNRFFKFMFTFGKPNFCLSGQKLFLDFKNPFKILAETQPRLWRGEATITQNLNSENWRRGRDSNSRYPLRYAIFPRWCTRPLCEPSLLFVYSRTNPCYTLK